MEGARAREQFVEHYAEAEDVGEVVHLLSAHLLGGHITDGAHHLAGVGLHGEGLRLSGGWTRGHRFGQAEIQNFDAAIAGEQDVIGLQIAVHDAGRVRCRETIGNLHGDIQRFAETELSAAQRLAIH